MGRQKQLGGQHLIHAGQALEAAAEYANYQNYACPHLFKNAGASLKEVGEAWQERNWEAVTYAAEDCSQYFWQLSQLQPSPQTQGIYKGASGELKVVASSREEFSQSVRGNFKSLSKCLKAAASVSPKENKDRAKFSASLRDAAKSIRTLAREEL